MTTYKLFSAAQTDGAVYIDLPISGKITEICFAGIIIAGAGGVGTFNAELSRVAVNQAAISNPRGVLASSGTATPAASQGASIMGRFATDEPVKSGERLYLNCASASNVATVNVACFITIA